MKSFGSATKLVEQAKVDGWVILPSDTKTPIAKQASARPRTLPQHLSTVCWSLARLGFSEGSHFFRETEKRSKWLVENGTPQAIANTAWAFATLGLSSPKYFGEVEKRSKWLVENGTPQNIANTAWAFATLGLSSSKYFGEVENRSTWLVENGNAQEVANTAWAFATLGLPSPKYFGEVEKRSKWFVKNGTPQAVANTAWAFATLGMDSRPFFESCLSDTSKFVGGSNKQAVLNLCYSMAILDVANKFELEFVQLWSSALDWGPEELHFEEQMQPGDISIEGWMQLVQAYEFANAGGLELKKPLIPSNNLELGDPLPSKSQREASQLLLELGFSHEEEVSPFPLDGKSLAPPGMLTIDMACRERQIAVEFDGPSHFLLDIQSGKRSNTENGATKAKRRFLERLGWKVHNIPYFDWGSAQGKEGKKKLLRQLLNLDDIS